MAFKRQPILALLIVGCVLFILHKCIFPPLPPPFENEDHAQAVPSQQHFSWNKMIMQYPPTSTISLPKGSHAFIPKVQYNFGQEGRREKNERKGRQDAVAKSFQRSWETYQRYAWLKDEVNPVSGESKNAFGGWAATAVDGLDTLWIMNMKREFEETVDALKTIDFSTTRQTKISVFETTIRFLGGLLGAYDVSEGQYPALLEKAVEVGDMLYAAFDTPNRMPVAHWDLKFKARLQTKTEGQESENQQMASLTTPLADLGSLTLEFTRLSQLTNDPKYFDAVQRVTDELEKAQNKTRLPGMWPTIVDAERLIFDLGGTFTLGGMSDSVYEYFPKQYILLGGRKQQYRDLYENSFQTFKNLFYRPMTPTNQDILLPGDIKVYRTGSSSLVPKSQHLSCFTGGMVGLAAKAFDRQNDMETARRLVDGCIWAYESMPSGIMPEKFENLPCTDVSGCEWNQEEWETKRINEAIPPGFVKVDDGRYLLRPEAIESVFVLYRLTGDKMYQDKAWNMFLAIEEQTKTNLAYSAIADVTRPMSEKLANMESFWFAETLKYFYLIFSEPDLVSLDEFVLNTEAHPFRRSQQ
ncbi:glycoside hydrolase family 47 protein [Xylona heveae TC161]|uniref:alpha-1,2-Mannosidase n=1 Tax=Xylona heveae (strain CBS 132557 / TC161) TaxID=1328760 RepID=A0A165H3P7_XYLHT|nr:glycoside hydrolase family 47 protein [Xylona heveae TC161]KZF22942.1 glycoside hydrolase family 47 protein [Xylona heveae TC161]